jgi:hypothetical protein
MGSGTPGERAPGVHWIGGWVDLRAGLEDFEKRKFFTPLGFELRLLVAIPTTLSWLLSGSILNLNWFKLY